jgi:predicted DNA-binding transcriptional regulator YafY
MQVLLPGTRINFEYFNHRNVVERRDVIFKGLDYGENEWYPEPQWFMRCYDMVRNADRSFALDRIDGFAVVETGLLDAVEGLA